MTREQVLALVSELRQELVRLYGDRLRGVYLFGSYARGDADEDSDIDVAIVLDGLVDSWSERKKSNTILSDLSLRENCLLSSVFLSREEFETTPFAVHRSIVREGVAI